MTPDPIEALLREMLTELQGLRADLAPRDIRSVITSHDALLPMLAATIADRAFSGREVMLHAALVDGPLREALAAAGLGNARQLGKWFRTIEGRAIAGLRLDCIGADNQGLIWRVSGVSHSRTHSAHCDDDNRGA